MPTIYEVEADDKIYEVEVPDGTPDPEAYARQMAQQRSTPLPAEAPNISPLEQNYGTSDLGAIGSALGEGLRRMGEGVMQLGMDMLGTRPDAKQYTDSVNARREAYVNDYAQRFGLTPDQASKFLGFGELTAAAVPIAKVANAPFTIKALQGSEPAVTTLSGAVARNSAAGALYGAVAFNPSGEDAKRLEQMGFGAVFAGSLAGAAAVFPAVVNWTKQTVAKQLAKYTATASPAERAFDAVTPGGSVFLTPGQMSGKPSAVKFERLVANDVAAGTYVKQLEGIGATYKQLQQSLKPGTTPDAGNVMLRVKERMTGVLKNIQDTANREYGAYATAASMQGEANNLRLDAPEVLSRLRDLRGSQADVYTQVKTFLGANDAQLAKKLATVENQDSVVEGIIQQYRLGPEEYDKALQIGIQTRALSGDSRLTMGELIRLTKGLNELFKIGKPEVTAAAKHLRGGLYADVDRLRASNVGSEQAFKTYDTMLGQYRNRMDYKEAVEGKLLSDSLNIKNNDDAVKLLDRIQSASEGEQTWTRQLLQSHDPELLQDLRSLAIARMTEAASGTMQGFAKGQRVGGGSVVTQPVKPGGYWLFDPKEREILDGGTEKLGRIMNNYDALGAVDIDPQGLARVGGGALTGNQGTLGVFLPGMIGKLAITRKLEKILFTPEGQQALSKLDPTSSVWGTAGRLAGLEYFRQQAAEE